MNRKNGTWRLVKSNELKGLRNGEVHFSAGPPWLRRAAVVRQKILQEPRQVTSVETKTSLYTGYRQKVRWTIGKNEVGLEPHSALYLFPSSQGFACEG